MDYVDQNGHIVDHIDQHDELKPQLLAIVPPIAMNGHDVFVSKSEQDAVRASHGCAKDKSQIMGFKCCNSVGNGEINTDGESHGVVLSHSVCGSVKLQS